MRTGRDNMWLEFNNVFCGISLGADFVAEHEHGIESMERLLGAKQNEDKFGLERRRCSPKHPERIILKQEGDVLNLLVGCDWLAKETIGGDRRSEWMFHDKETLMTAWNDSYCIIRVKGEDNFKKLKEIYENLIAGNVAVWLGGGGVFKNASLCFAIIKKVPKDMAKTMADSDIDTNKLEEAGKKTGIRKRIERSNEIWKQMQEVENNQACYDAPPHCFLSLRPKWKNGQKTKYPVVFWLSPYNQDLYESGVYTVEELDLWLQNKGPVTKKGQVMKV